MECLVLLEKRAALVRALLAHGRECCHAIAHAKGPLVREELGLDGGAVKRARHDLEAAQPAFSGALGKAAVHREQGQEVAGREGMRDLLVKLWPLGRKAVRTALEQLVGKVAGRHVGHAPAKLAGDALDQDAHAVVVLWREARDPHAHHLEVLGVALDEVKRNHGPVVERGVALALAAGGEALLRARVCERANKLLVIDGLVAGLRRPKHGEAALCPSSGRDVDVVCIHGCVRA